LDRATSFFISQYVFGRIPPGSSSPPSRGHYEYIPSLLQGEKEDSVLATTVAAAGLAGLANVANSNAWRVDAYKLHGLALTRLKDAVEVEGKATEDKTLAAIVLMGTFEVTIFHLLLLPVSEESPRDRKIISALQSPTVPADCTFSTYL
jgi:hypothetical protein